MGLEMSGLEKSQKTLVDALLPGIGFFGGTPETALRIPVGAAVDRIELSIEAPASEILNIGEIRLLGVDGEALDRRAACASVELSSIYGGKSPDDCFELFVAGQLLHTETEARPSIVIRLRQAIALESLILFNRRDVYGSRSRHLVVRAYAGDALAVDYRNLTPEKVMQELTAVLDEAGMGEHVPQADAEVPGFLASVRAGLLDRIGRGAVGLAPTRLMQLLPVYGAKGSITYFHLALCAHIVLERWGDAPILRTSFLEPLGRVLSSDFALERLKVELEALIERRRGRAANVVISRHHIHESRLTTEKEKFLAALDRVVSILAGQGIDAMVGYGTLLGAVRSGTFLPHDDDVDLIIFDGSCSQEQAQLGKARIIEALRAHGADARDSGYWHLHAVVDGVVVDLFPAWREGDDMFMPMEQLKLRAVPARHVLPVGRISLYDRVYPAPSNPEAFLADRYGEGWNVPDPYYEWPWPIERMVTRVKDDTRAALERRARIPRRHFGRLCRVAWGQRVRRGTESPPMNCLAIVEVARETGYDAVELDVLVTSDRVPVLGHDDRLVGPDGEIVVSQATADEVSRFRLGSFDGKDCYVPTLSDALVHASGIDVQIDSRMQADQMPLLRQVVENTRFDPTRLQFCTYNVAQAQALLRCFPESVLMWKTYRSFSEIDEYFLDEAKALGMDGVMLSVPRNFEDYSGFMRSLRDRGLRVLFFIHSGDEQKLKRMVQKGVDYVTTLTNDMETFKAIATAS